jgi:hypothetical protein
MCYDIIGDIHGCNATLQALLEKLGYARRDAVYRHPSRRVVFLGDFIDRGPQQRAVLDTVRPMVAAGAALAVMGNHEFNAIAWATPDKSAGGFLRAHSDKNLEQHRAFLQAYADSSADYAAAINWFRALPLWLDLDGLRIIHACWDRQAIHRITEAQQGSNLLGGALLESSCHPGSWQFAAIETLLKGREIPLQSGVSFRDKDGTMRQHMRVRWWDRDATTYRAAFLGPESARTHIPDDGIVGDHLVEYAHDAPPVFLGHYWMEGQPAPLAENIACLDYSVAKPGGKLVAYRWNGERRLLPQAFVSVGRLEDGSARD